MPLREGIWSRRPRLARAGGSMLFLGAELSSVMQPGERVEATHHEPRRALAARDGGDDGRREVNGEERAKGEGRGVLDAREDAQIRRAGEGHGWRRGEQEVKRAGLCDFLTL